MIDLHQTIAVVLDAHRHRRVLEQRLVELVIGEQGADRLVGRAMQDRRHQVFGVFSRASTTARVRIVALSREPSARLSRQRSSMAGLLAAADPGMDVDQPRQLGPIMENGQIVIEQLLGAPAEQAGQFIVDEDDAAGRIGDDQCHGGLAHLAA